MTNKPIQITNDRYRLGFHVSAESGWINDPNGFCYFNGYYHIFYQHYPYSPEWGPMHWGHARSKDLVHWENLPIALTPGSKEDKDGCFSGSAIVKDDTLYLFYTGHHYYGDGDPDHFWQNQNMAYSTDGVNFTKYENNPVIASEPEDNTHHFRDPKVWEDNGNYYMILGSQGKDGLGRVILYQSSDLKDWTYIGDIAKSTNIEKEGFMWECPDLFTLNNKDILMCSPQGIKQDEKKYLNLFQTGYFLGHLNSDKTAFTRDQFIELDHGHDFYAAQTTLTPDGRRILIGWMAMWESPMPEKEDGWAGALTLPRELELKDNHLYMKPVEELKALRTHTLQSENLVLESPKLLSDQLSHLEINVTHHVASIENLTTSFEIKDNSNQLILSLKYNAEINEFELYRADKNDSRYATIAPHEELNLRIFVDKSSVEIFINDGEVVFTERYYTEDTPNIWMDASHSIETTYTVHQLNEIAVQF
ncbi:glycoside hydrolase family 32 protein [Mammaliicoccus sp. Dog046]|uniref:glycoside hydrolase family 32 protein n=1 Tax=Mammaliicoccus sp. Dog046 TaxID=3034233 RepID=UPI002B25B94C|nr:glycoside hydrolase family 32 protein [Mammaliicoccus sp. Dog046]WQK85697.1 glycoside hydrolase family 32 protein [Mammaliicoccus sp. Dog046]